MIFKIRFPLRNDFSDYRSLSWILDHLKTLSGAGFGNLKWQCSFGTAAQIWTTQVRCDSCKCRCCGPDAGRKCSSHMARDREAGDCIERSQCNLRKRLAVRRLCARWVTDRLTDSQKGNPVNLCRQLLARFERKYQDRLKEVTTGNETGT